MLHAPHFLQQAKGFYSRMGCELLIWLVPNQYNRGSHGHGHGQGMS